MKLYTVKFKHYAQRGSKEGIGFRLLAESEEDAFALISRECFPSWEDWAEEGDTADFDPLRSWWDKNPEEIERAKAMGLTVDEEYGVISGPKLDVVRFIRCDPDDPSDCYYGYTSWSWDEGVEVSGEEVAVLLRLGIAREVK